MSSMEVDIPQVNGLPELLNGSTLVQPKVHFSDSITVDETVKTTFNLRPKHKARRRLRVAVVETGEQTVTKPISPSKLKKIAEKDRHSRTGRRGLPKKGMYACMFICNGLSSINLNSTCAIDQYISCILNELYINWVRIWTVYIHFT